MNMTKYLKKLLMTSKGEWYNYSWRPPSLRKLTPIVFDMELSNLSLEVSKSIYNRKLNQFILILLN